MPLWGKIATAVRLGFGPAAAGSFGVQRSQTCVFKESMLEFREVRSLESSIQQKNR